MKKRAYVKLLEEQKDLLFRSIGKNLKIAGLGAILSGGVVFYDYSTYVVKLNQILHDKEIKEVLSYESEEKQNEGWEKIWNERNYEKKLEDKLENSKKMWELAKTGVKTSISYGFLAPIFLIGRYFLRKRRLEEDFEFESHQ